MKEEEKRKKKDEEEEKEEKKKKNEKKERRQTSKCWGQAQQRRRCVHAVHAVHVKPSPLSDCRVLRRGRGGGSEVLVTNVHVSITEFEQLYTRAHGNAHGDAFADTHVQGVRGKSQQ